MALKGTTAIGKDIKNNTPASLYYFYGHDTAAVESFTLKMINKLCPNEAKFMNFHKFVGKQFDIAAFADACQALPMFADRVVIAVNDLKAEDLSNEDMKDLKNILSDLAETTTVIIYATGVDLYKNKRSLTDKNKRFCDFCAKYGDVCEFAYKTARELGKSIAALLEKNGCTIGRREAEYLAEICLCDSAYINQEINKLSAYAQGREITMHDIDELCVKHIESDGYELAVNILSNNAKFVFNRLKELEMQNYDAFEIVSIIGFSMTDIYRAKLARADGLSYQNAAEDFNYPKNREFAVKKAFQICGNISLAKIKAVLAILSETDLALKTRSLDKKGGMLALEQSIARCLVAENGRR